MMDTDTDNYQNRRDLCYMCHNTHEVCISNVGQTPCSGRSNVLRSLLDQARTPSHGGPRPTPTNRTQGGNDYRTPIQHQPPTPRPETTYRVRLSPSSSATYIKPAEFRSSNNIPNPESPKKPRTRNRRPLKRNPREDLTTLQGPSPLGTDNQMDVNSNHRKDLATNGQSLPTTDVPMEGINDYLEQTSNEHLLRGVNYRILNEQVGAAAAAEDALIYERERQEELRHYFETTKTEPWIRTCTAEEAIERARQLREEYDRFLIVLFGRQAQKLQDPTRMETECSHETLAPESLQVEISVPSLDEAKDARPQPVFPASAPRKEQECGSMMFRAPMLRKCKSFNLEILAKGSCSPQPEASDHETKFVSITNQTPTPTITPIRNPHDEEEITIKDTPHLPNGPTKWSDSNEYEDVDPITDSADAPTTAQEGIPHDEEEPITYSTPRLPNGPTDWSNN
ncbi:hypothetical protein P7C70_g9327, partial [Phenoliferia sp. Uapishka_3]